MKFWHSLISLSMNTDGPCMWNSLCAIWRKITTLKKTSVLLIPGFFTFFQHRTTPLGLSYLGEASSMMWILDQHNKSWRNSQDCFTMLLEHQRTSIICQTERLEAQHQGDDRVRTQMTSAYTFDSWWLWFTLLSEAISRVLLLWRSHCILIRCVLISSIYLLLLFPPEYQS